MEHNAYFRPYDGDEPYIFISYAHADSGAVMDIITKMHDRGFRIWYDEGIEVGSEWTECIASHLAGAGLMIGFVSNSYMASDNCRREMNYAVQKKKQIINVYLSETSLTPGMELQIGGIWALMKYTYPSDGYFFSKLYESPALCSGDYGEGSAAEAIPVTAEEIPERKERGKRRLKGAPGEKKPRRSRKTLIVSLSLLVLVMAVAALWIVGKRTGYIGRVYNRHFRSDTEITALSGDTAAQFKNPLLEQAARDYCGKQTGELTVSDLSGLTSLFICGGEYSFAGAYTLGDIASTDAEAEVTDADGNAATLSRGSIYDLTDLQYFTGLTRLQIAFQSLTALYTLPECAIEELDISANRMTSLSGIGALPNLRVLTADGNPITDTGDLADCLSLTSLSLKGAGPADLSTLTVLPALSVFRISNCTFANLRPVLYMGTLTRVELYSCDLSARIFDFLDGSRLSCVRFEDCVFSAVTNIDKMTASELWLIRCSGADDWSALSGSGNLKTLHIDASMEKYFSGGDYGFSIVIEE